MARNNTRYPMRSRDLYFRLLHYVLPYRKVFALSLLGTVVFAATEPAMPAFMKLLLDETFVARSESGLVLLPVLLVLLFVVRGIASFTGIAVELDGPLTVFRRNQGTAGILVEASGVARVVRI